jgi:arylsulfatase A-like enzyme
VKEIRSAILVTIDCLRADHVGFLGYSRPTTPFLNSLAPQAKVFANAIVAGAPTYHSMPAILTSRYPLALGRDVLGVAAGEATLATVFRSLGHRTAAFLAGNPYLSARCGYDQGFEVFEDFLAAASCAHLGSELLIKDRSRTKWNRRLADACHRFEPLGSVYDELYFQYCERSAKQNGTLDDLRRFPSADRVIDAAIAWLKKVGNSPFFLWLHLMDPHAPYYPKEQALSWMGRPMDAARARYLNSYWSRSDLPVRRLMPVRDEIITLYDAGIRWADAQIEMLARYLQDAGLWDDSLIAVTADHGEEFLDHGARFHAPATVFEEIVHVPLLLRVPGVPAEVAEAPFSLAHLAPAILCGARVTAADCGRANFPNSSRECEAGPVITECISSCTNPFQEEDRMGPRILAVRDNRYKLVLNFDRRKDSLFDLASDPQEANPLSEKSNQPVRAKLLALARQHLAESSQLRDAKVYVQSKLRDLRLKLDGSSMKVAV